jgi:hypothetical protein
MEGNKMYSEKTKDNSLYLMVSISLLMILIFLLGYVFEIKAEDKIETKKIILLK